MRLPALVLAALILGSLSTTAAAQDGAAIRHANARAKVQREAALRAAKAQSVQRFIEWKRRMVALQKAQAAGGGAPHARAAQTGTSQRYIDALRKRTRALQHAKAAAAAGTRRAPASRAPAHPEPAAPRR
jgi:hypothetical protein